MSNSLSVLDSLKDSLKYRLKNKLKVYLSTNKIYKIIHSRQIYSKIKRLSTLDSELPLIVYTESTNRCNARCTTCPHDQMTREVGTMDFNLYSKIVDDCERLNIKEIHLHNFGEPLLDKMLAKKISYAKAKKIEKVVIFTNASLLKDEKSLEIINAGLDEIYISIDGTTKETYEKIRINLDFDAVIENTLKLQNLKKQVRKSKPKVNVHCVLTDQSKHEAMGLQRFWKSKVDNLTIEVAHNWGGLKLAGYDYNFLGRKGPYRYPCDILWTSFFMLWNGDVSICCLDFNGETIVGNIKNNSIDEIWNNEKYKLYRQIHFNREFRRIPLCSKCLVNTSPFGWRNI